MWFKVLIKLGSATQQKTNNIDRDFFHFLYRNNFIIGNSIWIIKTVEESRIRKPLKCLPCYSVNNQSSRIHKWITHFFVFSTSLHGTAGCRTILVHSNVRTKLHHARRSYTVKVVIMHFFCSIRNCGTYMDHKAQIKGQKYYL